MKRIFVTMLLSFLLYLLTFLSISAAIFYIGYKRSIENWSIERKKVIEEQVHEEIKDILSSMTAGAETKLESRLRSLIPNNVQVIVYNADKNVIYSRRGSGMGGARRMRQKGLQGDTVLNQFLTPVQVNGGIIGYYRIGPVQFWLENANAQFLKSMRKTIWFGVDCSFVLAFLFAFLISKRLSDSARTVSGTLMP